ncbi:hypothetical protein AK812_SmicGene47976, partial [Symbiodinium microadriaticum]
MELPAGRSEVDAHPLREVPGIHAAPGTMGVLQEAVD